MNRVEYEDAVKYYKGVAWKMRRSVPDERLAGQMYGYYLYGKLEDPMLKALLSSDIPSIAEAMDKKSISLIGKWIQFLWENLDVGETWGDPQTVDSHMSDGGLIGSLERNLATSGNGNKKPNIQEDESPEPEAEAKAAKPIMATGYILPSTQQQDTGTDTPLVNVIFDGASPQSNAA